MAYLQETDTWVEGIYQLELQDPVEGGADGVSNRQAKELGSRTKYLKKTLDDFMAEGNFADHNADVNAHEALMENHNADADAHQALREAILQAAALWNIDINGDLMPANIVSGSLFWDIDDNGDLMPKTGGMN
jgi:hypothetical protein